VSDMGVKETEIKADLMGFDEALAHSIHSLTSSDKKIKLLSDLYIEEIPFISLLLTVARKEKLDNLNNFVKEFLRLRVSYNRKGRDEIVIVGIGGKKEEKKKSVGISDLFSGLR